MGAVMMKLIDAILFLFFLIISIAVPILDPQTCLPSNIFPDILVHLKTSYAHEYGDYLISEKPHFFVGLSWVELLFAWPLSIASLYGILAGKSWLRTTCLLYGASTLTSMKWTHQILSSCWKKKIKSDQPEEPMGAVMKLIDAILFFFFLIIAIAAPLLDAQTCLPSNIFPDILVHLNTWYTQEYGDYLASEKPHFFVGLVWLELLFAWPLSIASLYGIVAGKSWMPTTCLLYGSSTLTAMVAILSELIGSGKASEKLLKMYSPFLGFAVLAILRGLLPHSAKSTAIGTRPVLGRKKRA